jgi:phage-related protein
MPKQPEKPLFWIGSSAKDLSKFPREVIRSIGFALSAAQFGQKSDDAKPMHGFGGAGVLEIVEDFKSDTYRAVYTVRFRGAIYVLHCYQKKSKKGDETPKTDMELIKSRLQDAQAEYEAWLEKQRE